MIGPVEKLRLIVHLAGDKRLHGSDYRVAAVVIDHYNVGHGYAWPGYARIGEGTGLSRASVARSVKRLHELGVIKKLRGGIKDGNKRTNSYRPAWLPPRVTQGAATPFEAEPGDANAPISSQADGIVSPMRPQQSHAGDHTSLTDAPLTTYYPAKVTQQGSSSGGGSPASVGASACGGRAAGGAPTDNPIGFEEWWRVYPKQEGRMEAKKAYAAALLGGATPGMLLDGAKQYALAASHREPKYIKFPANWLRGECWLENPQPQRPAVTNVNTSAPRNKSKPISKLRVSEKTLANRAAEESLADIKARDKIQKISALGRIGNVEILSGPNWRSFCVIRTLYDMRITKCARSDLTHTYARSIADVVKDEATGKITTDHAQLERHSLAIVHKWTADELQAKHDEAKRNYDVAKQTANAELVPATPYGDEDFG